MLPRIACVAGSTPAARTFAHSHSRRCHFETNNGRLCAILKRVVAAYCDDIRDRQLLPAVRLAVPSFGFLHSRNRDVTNHRTHSPI